MEVFTVYAANGKTDGKTDWDRVASFESDKEALAEMTRVSKKFACCCDMRKEERKTEQPNDNPCKECPTERHDCESCEHFDRGGQEEFTDKLCIACGNNPYPCSGHTGDPNQPGCSEWTSTPGTI